MVPARVPDKFWPVPYLGNKGKYFGQGGEGVRNKQISENKEEINVNYC